MPLVPGRVTLIAAIDINNAIGKGGRLPWHLAADMDHFRNTTKGGIVVMGRKTWESIPEKYRPLPNRENWILSRTLRSAPMGTRLFNSKKPVLLYGRGKEIFVMGGAEVYRDFMPHATRLLLTHVQANIRGADAYFPYVPQDWTVRSVSEHEQGNGNDFSFRIVEYTRPGSNSLALS